jgi:hypothetical protein
MDAVLMTQIAITFFLGSPAIYVVLSKRLPKKGEYKGVKKKAALKKRP